MFPLFLKFAHWIKSGRNHSPKKAKTPRYVPVIDLLEGRELLALYI